MSRSTEALVLSCLDLGEADLVLSLLTKEYGKLRGVAKNARKSRLRFGGAVDRFGVVEARFRFRRRSDLVQLEECELLAYPRRLREELPAHASACLLCEAVEALTAEREPVPELYDLLRLLLGLLDAGEDPRRTRLYGLLTLLGPTGFAPLLDRCASCGRPAGEIERPFFIHEAGGIVCAACRRDGRRDGTSPAVLRLLCSMRATSPERLARLRPSASLMGKTQALLLDFTAYHAGRRLPSAEFIEKMKL